MAAFKEPLDTRNLTDTQVMILTLLGEARGLGKVGMAHVATVIMERKNIDLGDDKKPDWWGEGIRQVCLMPAQFSCWLKSDPNRKKLLAWLQDDPLYQIASQIVWSALNGSLANETNGATHYFAKSLPPEDRPKWADGKTPCFEDLGHLFFRMV